MRFDRLSRIESDALRFLSHNKRRTIGQIRRALGLPSKPTGFILSKLIGKGLVRCEPIRPRGGFYDGRVSSLFTANQTYTKRLIKMRARTVLRDTILKTGVVPVFVWLKRRLGKPRARHLMQAAGIWKKH